MRAWYHNLVEWGRFCVAGLFGLFRRACTV